MKGNDNLKVKAENQSLRLEGVNNAREVGGYLTNDGRKVKRGKFLRSGNLSKATDRDIARLKDEYNLKYVVDFRTTLEETQSPDRIIEGVIYNKIRLFNENKKSNEYAAMANIYFQDPIKVIIPIIQKGLVNDYMYINTLKDEHVEKSFNKFFKLLLENKDGALLCHCTGGKDRAGMASALFLSSLGVSKDTIIEDFNLSNVFYKKSIDHMVQEAGKYTNDKNIIQGVKTLTGVNENCMLKVFDILEKEYGCVENYLEERIGLTKDDLKELQEIYLQ